MKQSWLNIAAIAIMILVFIILSGMVIGKLGSIEIDAHDDQTEAVVTGTEIIDRRISADNTTYELLYKTTYSNGLSISEWREVDWDDYIRLWEEGNK